MSNHETIEAGVLGGVALLFVLAILCIGGASSETHSADESASTAAEAE